VLRLDVSRQKITRKLYVLHVPSVAAPRAVATTAWKKLTNTFQGNAYFREGDYHKAILEYDTAMKIHGPRLAYLSNAAAAWLRLEEWVFPCIQERMIDV